MRLPNAQRAIVDLTKLRDYVLNQTHERGRHKARVFRSALGMTAENAGELQTALLAAALTCDAVLAVSDEFGDRYTVDFEMTHIGKSARVRVLGLS